MRVLEDQELDEGSSRGQKDLDRRIREWIYDLHHLLPWRRILTALLRQQCY